MKTQWTLADEMKRGMKYQYRRIDISTLKGLKQAERLQARGWKLVGGGLFTIVMQKEDK